MCRHVCPVGRTTKHESNTPHGWALLISSVDRGQAEWDADSVATLYQCTQCGLCLSNCVTDQPLPSSIAAARAHVAALGLAPKAVQDVDARLRRWGNPYQESDPLAASGAAPAALFVGAAAPYRRPAGLAAAVRLLQTLGIEHVQVAAGLSSVYLPFALGLHETARLLGQSALQEIAASGCRRLIVLTPEDARAFRDTLPELGLHLPDGVEVVELISLLAEGLAGGSLALRQADLSITYHDPAHTPNARGRAALARQVLAALTCQPLHEMFWREQRAAPGGSTGGLELTNPSLAARMTRDRLAEAVATGAEWLVTEDPTAQAQFDAQAARSIRVAGLYELLVQHLA
jgi:heterodisulfide reductase subunit D